MKRIWIYPVLAASILVVVFPGCEKSGFDCFTSTGQIILEERSVADFDSIDVADYVNVILTQDSVNSVIVEAGKNIIKDISTDVTDGKLYLKNNTRCNWVRSYSKPINVYIHVRNLLKIYYNASGNISSTNEISSDSLMIDVWGGCGTIELSLDIPSGLFLIHQGTANLILHGKCDISSIAMYDYGKIDAGDLRTGYSFANNTSSNNCYIYAWQSLEATIGSIGNIYYTGNPGKVITHIEGEGRVIPY